MASKTPALGPHERTSTSHQVAQVEWGSVRGSPKQSWFNAWTHPTNVSTSCCTPRWPHKCSTSMCRVCSSLTNCCSTSFCWLSSSLKYSSANNSGVFRVFRGHWCDTAFLLRWRFGPTVHRGSRSLLSCSTAGAHCAHYYCLEREEVENNVYFGCLNVTGTAKSA
jgi:hypothetical protein